MKSTFILASAMVIIFVSCKKNHQQQTIKTQLQGQWELRHQSVSWQPDSNLAAGNGRRLIFLGSNWNSTVHGQTSGSYTIIESPQFPTGVCGEEYTAGYQWKINFINGTDTVGKYVHLSGDTLTLRQGCFAIDGGRLEQYVHLPNIQ